MLVFSWLMVFMVGAQSEIRDISAKVLIFLILSGLSTGISWLCYFKALQIGDINKVTPIDKSSTVITMLLAFIFLREEITWLKFVSMILIGIGTYLMIQKKETKEKAEDKKWLLCSRFRCFCQSYLYFGKDWNSGCQFKSWNCDQDCCCIGDGVDCSICDRKAEYG